MWQDTNSGKDPEPVVGVDVVGCYDDIRGRWWSIVVECRYSPVIDKVVIE